MRIISSFHDYYDSALGYGIDPHIIYKRETEEYKFTEEEIKTKIIISKSVDSILKDLIADIKPYIVHNNTINVKSNETFSNRKYVEFDYSIIGIAGALYFAFYPELVHIDLRRKIPYVKPRIYFKIDDFIKYVQAKVVHKSDVGIICHNIKSKSKNSDLYNQSFNVAIMTEIQSKLNADKYKELFIEMNSPLFELYFENRSYRNEYMKFEINPCLKKLDFMKVLSPHDVFQKVSMFIGNNLANTKVPSGIVPDEILCEEKGFDEWSFRRHKLDCKKYLKKISKGNC